MAEASTKPRWLSDEEQMAWRQIAALLELVPAALDAQLRRDSGLTLFEYFSMAMLSEAPERALPMKTLAARSNASLPRLSRVMSGLAVRGLVERRSCAEDARVTIVTLTEPGFEVLSNAAPGHVAQVRQLVLDPIGPEHLEAVTRLSSSMLDVVDPNERMWRSPSGPEAAPHTPA